MGRSWRAGRSTGTGRVVLYGAAAAGAGLVGAAATGVAFHVSPRPGARVVRGIFERGGAQTQRLLEPWDPADDVTTFADVPRGPDPADPDARVDVHVPARVVGTGERLPTVVWVHGGGWLAGRKEGTRRWARILAARGFAVVVPDYTLAPRAHYPRQLEQVLDVLTWLRHDPPAHVDPDRLVVAGDSAGATLAAQAVTALRYPEYAAEVGLEPPVERAATASAVRGVVLACGIFDLSFLDTARGAGGWLLRTIGWAYAGRRDFMAHPRAATLALVDQVRGPLPPTFVTGGNGDPLSTGSRAYADRLAAAGTDVDALLFPDDYRDPSTDAPLPHEYQFDLRLDAAQTALERLVAFLARCTAP